VILDFVPALLVTGDYLLLKGSVCGECGSSGREYSKSILLLESLYRPPGK
jgi:hypothetical protein